jgi:dephospho-CoA kinase
MEFINRNPKIIVLSGKAQSGKNVCASIIKDYYNSLNLKTVVVSYASYLKMYAKEVLGWDGNDNSKPRDFLQQVGVELIKNKINSNMLIDRVIDDIKVYSYFFDVIVISDARFVDEISVIKNDFSDVVVIHINGMENSLTNEQRNHSTETGLDNYNDYDFIINNYGSKDELNNKIMEVLKCIN